MTKIPKVLECKILSADEIRQLCVKQHYYNHGKTSDYLELLENIPENVTNTDLYEIALNIYEHTSNTDWQGYSKNEIIQELMFELGQITNTFFTII